MGAMIARLPKSVEIIKQAERANTRSSIFPVASTKIQTGILALKGMMLYLKPPFRNFLETEVEPLDLVHTKYTR
jgi:hypothetical protein